MLIFGHGDPSRSWWMRFHLLAECGEDIRTDGDSLHMHPVGSIVWKDECVAEFSVNCSTRDDGIGVLAVGGEVDLFTAERVEHALRDCFDVTAVSVIADLTDVNFIDSIGLRTLIQAYARLRSQGRRFALVTRDTPVLRALRLSGVGEVVTVAGTVDEAVAAIAT